MAKDVEKTTSEKIPAEKAGLPILGVKFRHFWYLFGSQLAENTAQCGLYCYIEIGKCVEITLGAKKYCLD